MLVVLLIHGKKSPDRGKKRIITAFAYFYLARYVILLMSLAFIPLPRPSKHLIGMSIFIFFNIIPFLWLKYFFLGYAERMQKETEDEGVLDKIYDGYNISKREQEIISLILAGKSNKEIADALYISAHTVKNHIYSIFQKLEVKTRYKLIHFVASFRKKQ